MRLSMWLAGAIVALTLVCDARAEDGFTALVLDGRLVKWGEPDLGSGATVTWAFLDRTSEFADARNCRAMAPISEISTVSRIDRAVVEHELAAAFAAWQRAADIRFEAAVEPKSADILIGADANPHGYAYTDVAPVGGWSHSIARADDRDAFRAGYGPGLAIPREREVASIERALICLNATRHWKAAFDGDLDRYDLRYTFMHEIGHAIGLDHSRQPGAVMSFRYLETFREPQAGDIAGARLIYGPPHAEQ